MKDKTFLVGRWNLTIREHDVNKILIILRNESTGMNFSFLSCSDGVGVYRNGRETIILSIMKQFLLTQPRSIEEDIIESYERTDDERRSNE